MLPKGDKLYIHVEGKEVAVHDLAFKVRTTKFLKGWHNDVGSAVSNQVLPKQMAYKTAAVEVETRALSAYEELADV